MSLRQQQIAVFFGTVVVIFSIFAGGVWLIAQRLTTEATLQTALLMARQVEIASGRQPAPASRAPGACCPVTALFLLLELLG